MIFIIITLAAGALLAGSIYLSDETGSVTAPQDAKHCCSHQGYCRCSTLVWSDFQSLFSWLHQCKRIVSTLISRKWDFSPAETRQIRQGCQK